jgi:orotate phosphoribosyltransferase
MLRTQDGWIDEYTKRGALWIHDDNKQRPHALLTSGKHSNGFFNSRLVISDEILLRDAACDLVELFVQQGGDVSKVDGVVGPQTGATMLAQLISEQLMAFTRSDCFWSSPAKKEEQGKKTMIFDPYEKGLIFFNSILLCDDVVTTAGSVNLTAEAVQDVSGVVLPFVLVLVNRSGLKEINGRKIIALIDRSMPTWELDKCPLCDSGSEAIRPKDNWARLNATY